jgi:hypothetical protein
MTERDGKDFALSLGSSPGEQLAVWQRRRRASSLGREA